MLKSHSLWSLWLEPYATLFGKEQPGAALAQTHKLSQQSQLCTEMTTPTVAFHCATTALDVPLLKELHPASCPPTQPQVGGGTQQSRRENTKWFIRPSIVAQSGRSHLTQPASPSMVDQGMSVCERDGEEPVQGCYANILLFPSTFPVMMCGEASGRPPPACTNSSDAAQRLQKASPD